MQNKASRRANLPCKCGSGKPYKRCHREQDRGVQEVLRKWQAGELPFAALVISESGERSSMQVGRVVVAQGGVERVLSEEMLTLTTNSVSGDSTKKSVAHISLPVDGSKGSISTAGNATVSNNSTAPTSLRLNGNSRKMKASSPSGGFAIARICRQSDTQLEYFDFLFGSKGQSENVDDAGRKSRPHVALHPDGNGKFLRLEGEGCEFSTERDYFAAAQVPSIVPRKIKIRSRQFSETLVAKFIASGTAVELVSLGFESLLGGA